MAHGNLPIALARSDSCDKAPSLEGGGFELPVPRAMQARLKAKIAGCGCMPPSIICGCRRWPSAKAQSEISEPNPYRARNRKFESVSLQRRVRCEPVSRGNSPSYVEKPRFSAGVRAGASGAVGRDAQDTATSGLRAVISQSGYIPVPRRRWVIFEFGSGSGSCPNSPETELDSDLPPGAT